MITTITEEFKLPSLGKMYARQFDPVVKMRSMTVADEMKRLSPSKYEYKAMAEIIDDCLLTKLPISVYDMYMCDYIYLLHKLRTVTYGPEYGVSYMCPNCGTIEKVELNLDDIPVKYFTPEFMEKLDISLPSGLKVKLRLQTPRDIDNISLRAADIKEKFPEAEDPTLLLTLASFIDTVDGQPVNQATILESLKKMPMRDMNVLAKKALKLQNLVGVDQVVKSTCSKCGGKFESTFRYTGEFFGPEVD